MENNPSEKYESVGMMTFPIYGKLKNVPNRQPATMFKPPKEASVWFSIPTKSFDTLSRPRAKAHKDGKPEPQPNSSAGGSC